MTARHERTDAQPRYALIGLGVLSGSLVLVLAFVAGLLWLFARGEPAAQSPRPSQPPAPRLEVKGGTDLAAVCARGARRLATYGWSDQPAGLAHIPLGRALQLTAQRGWADAEPTP